MSSSEPPPGSYPPQGPPPQGPPPGGPPPGGYPPPGPPGGYPPFPSGSRQPSQKNVFAALFDITFSTFITPTIIKAVYLIVMIVLGLVWIGWTIAGFSDSAGLGILVLIGGAVVMLLYLAFIRMTLEFYLAIVRMSEDIHRRLPGG